MSGGRGSKDVVPVAEPQPVSVVDVLDREARIW